MLATQCINPVLLLYLKHRGWVTEDNVTFFGVVTAVGSLVPVVFNPLSGWWSARRGVKDVMLWGSLMSVVGIGVIAEVDSRYAFVVGYALVFFLQSLRRTVHQSYISAHTTPKQRLRAMSWAPLGTSLGAVVGSGLVLLCDYGPNPSDSLVWKHMELNTYTLAFACALLATLIKVIAICVGFKPLDRGPQAKAREPLWEGVVKGRDEHGTIHTFDSHSHVRFCLVFFSIVMFVMNLSVGFYMVSLHPLLVDRFHFGQTDMARVSMVYCALAIVPPLVMAAISKKVSSRTVLIAGMTLKLSGCLLFSLPAVLGASHHLQLWTLVVAYVFILKGAIFVVTAALTLFSQLVGKRNSATYMGIVTSCFAMGMYDLLIHCSHSPPQVLRWETLSVEIQW